VIDAPLLRHGQPSPLELRAQLAEAAGDPATVQPVAKTGWRAARSIGGASECWIVTRHSCCCAAPQSTVRDPSRAAGATTARLRAEPGLRPAGGGDRGATLLLTISGGLRGGPCPGKAGAGCWTRTTERTEAPSAPEGQAVGTVLKAIRAGGRASCGDAGPIAAMGKAAILRRTPAAAAPGAAVNSGLKTTMKRYRP